MNTRCSACGGLVFGTLESTGDFYCSGVHQSNEPKINYGWICPRCTKVHSPNSTTCDCSSITQAIPLDDLISNNKAALDKIAEDLFLVGEARWKTDKEGNVTVPKWYILE
jgi:hypothetical protein